VTWIFCAGMIRSGSTLQYQLASTIVEHAGVGERVGYAPEAEFERVRKEHAHQARRMLVFKAHVCLPAFVDACTNEGALVIYSYRDIRDVAVSASRKFGKSFDELRDAGWLDQAIDDYYKWLSLPRTLVSRYDEMRDDVAGEAARINRHLGTPLPIEEVKELARGFSLEAQKRRVSQIRERVGPDIGSRDIAFDPTELLHHNHIYDGETGGWRRLLSPDQIAFLNERYAKWLAEARYATQ
jgi:hypothetical protein